jgi:hypothetical protein
MLLGAWERRGGLVVSRRNGATKTEWEIRQMIEGPGSPRVQAVFVRAHLRMVAAGMEPSRGLTKRKLLDKAGEITGVLYGRGMYGAAIADLTMYIDGH